MQLRFLVTIFYFIVVFFNTGIAIYFFLNPPIYVLHLSESIFLEIWPSLSIKDSRWLIVFGLFTLSCLSCILSSVQSKKKYYPDKVKTSRVIFLISPLGYLPLACLPLFAANHLSAFLSTNLPVFIVLLLFTIVLTRIISPLLDSKKDNSHTALWAIGIFVVSSTLYAFGGHHLSTHAGEHVGDEGHYLIQAQSLYEDRDLDIRNNIYQALKDDPSHALSRAALHLEDGETPSLFLRPGWKGRFHVAANSRGEAWYSWHPYGLPVLLAPAWPWGLGARHAILGMISGAGLAGLFLLCRQLGAGNVASLLAVLSLGASVFWGAYSFRTLPEVLGGTLLIWCFWGIAAQQQRPWTSLFVVAACCSYLPISHVRFLPMSLMAMGLYGLFVLLGSERLRVRLVRLSVFTLLCMTGYGVYAYIQFSMFPGGSHTGIQGILFTYPPGAWGILASDRGIISLLPVFFWLAGAMIVWFVVDKNNRLFWLGLAATFFACLIVNTTNHMYTGGSSMPGRYVVAVVPLLFVGAALMLERAEYVGRALFIFLSLFSTMLLILTLYYVKYMKSGFFVPIHQLNSFPLFQSLYFPHAVFHRYSSAEFIWTTIYCVTAIAAVSWILYSRPKKVVSLALLLIILALGIQAMHSRNTASIPMANPYAYLHILPIPQAKSLVLVDPENTRPAWEIRYDLARLHSFTGEWAAKDGADYGRVRIALQDKHGEGVLAFGGYQHVFPGWYAALFDVRLEGETDQSVATLDVSLDRGMDVLAKSETGGGVFEGTIMLDFEARDFWLIEPRVRYNGVGNIELRGMTIREIIPPGADVLPKIEFSRLSMEMAEQVFPAYLRQIQEAGMSD